MKKCCIIGTGKRFEYFFPIFEFLIKKKYIYISSISNRTGVLNNKYKIITDNIYNNYDIMITNDNPDIVIILVPANQNFPIVQDINNKYQCKIFVETPLYNGNKIKNKERIHILENWIYLPLEILKQNIINSNILGNIKEIINNHRSYEYHGIAQLRSYYNSNSYNNIEKKKNETIFYEKNGNILRHKYPKIKNNKIIIIGDNFNIISDCIVEKDNKYILKIIFNSKEYNPTVLFKNDILKNIKINIDGNEFSWSNEFDVDLDQHQYGSLKSIIGALNGNFYNIENHIIDLI
jgi:hypothetical protein